MLADMLGVKYSGIHDVNPTYIAPVADGDPLFGDYTRKYPYMLKDSQYSVRLAGGKLLAEAVLPICGNSDSKNFVTAISDPPMRYTGQPSLVYNTYGNGRTIYSASTLENSGIAEIGDFFCGLIKLLAGELDINVNAPGCVHHSAVKTRDGRILCMLFNTLDVTPPVPVEGIVIRIKTNGVTNVAKLPEGTEAPWSVENGYLTIHADKLELFDMYEIKPLQR